MHVGSAPVAVMGAGMVVACLAAGTAVAAATGTNKRARRSALVGVGLTAVCALVVLVATRAIMVVREYSPPARQGAYPWRTWERVAVELEAVITIILGALATTLQSRRLRAYVLNAFGVLVVTASCLLVVALSLLLWYSVLERLPF